MLVAGGLSVSFLHNLHVLYGQNPPGKSLRTLRLCVSALKIILSQSKAKLGCQKRWAGVPNRVKAQEWACANRKEHDNEQQPQTSRGFCRSRTRWGRNGRPDAWSETRTADRQGRTQRRWRTHDGWDSWPSPPPSPPWLEPSAPAAPASASTAAPSSSPASAEALALMATSSGWRQPRQSLRS